MMMFTNPNLNLTILQFSRHFYKGALHTPSTRHHRRLTRVLSEVPLSMCLPQDLWVIEVIERLFIYFKKELNWSFEVLTILSQNQI
uniref:Uncharacterized protein n=2 Tax=Anguilla anguilla TaxID=7936 RepID=A0A0E9UCJ2_ANGAN